MAKYIEDFGEKIGGAKKDLWRERGLNIEDLQDLDLREYLQYVTKDNIWPTPNYVEYLETGMQPVCIYFMKQIRDKLAAKTEVRNDGKDRERAERYIQFINDVRDTCEQIKTMGNISKFRDILIIDHKYKDDNNNWTVKGIDTPGLDNTFLKFMRFSENDIQELYYETEIQKFPMEFRGDLKGVTVRKSYYNGGYYLVKGNKVLNRNKVFKTVDEALEYGKNELRDELDGKKSTTKRENKTVKVVRPQLEYISRTGPDLRKGHDVNTEHLLQAFKFRGGEFGNWNTQEDRQAYLNYAFDAFVDLAYVLQCPLEFLSFSPHGSYNDQMLAIAFGARGSGSALAHYECGRVVINLTKMRGAGCLAHEWGHAFDDFLGVKCGVKGLKTFLSSVSIYNGKELKYPEIVEAFNKVKTAMKEKVKPAEEVLEEYNKEIDKLVNKNMKSWIDHTLRYFDKSPGEQRPAATAEQVAKMNEIVDNLYKTTKTEYYDQFVSLYKEVKGILPRKEDRDAIESLMRRVNYIKEAIEKYNKKGTFDTRKSKETDFYRCAQELDKNRKEPYYTDIVEMFARSFEAYVEDKLGFKSQYLVHSTKNNALYGDLKPYPEGEERITINNAIDELIKIAVATFVEDGKKFNFNMYSNNEDWTDKYSTKKSIPVAPKQEVRQIETTKRVEEPATEDNGIIIESAVIEIYAGFMNKVDNIQAGKVAEQLQSMLKGLGQHYYTGHKAKV